MLLLEGGEEEVGQRCRFTRDKNSLTLYVSYMPFNTIPIAQLSKSFLFLSGVGTSKLAS